MILQIGGFFKCLRKTSSVRAEVMFCGKLFHTAGPATAKALVPTVDSLDDVLYFACDRYSPATPIRTVSTRFT